MATVQNIIVNELLCFVSNKVKKMTYYMLLKLVMDFYGDEATFHAKSVLLDNVIIPEDDEKKRSRKGLNKKLNSMKDILNIFLVLTLEELPLFVAQDLANLPPLSMDNFDISSVIKDMESIKNQMKIMQEVQESTLIVHAALCNDKKREISVDQSPAPSTGATPHALTPHTPTVTPPTSPQVPAPIATPAQHRRIDDNGGTDEDILLLADIQGRLSFSPNRRPRNRSPPWRHSRSNVDTTHHRHNDGESRMSTNRERRMSSNRERRMSRDDGTRRHESHRFEDREESHMAYNRHRDDINTDRRRPRDWPSNHYNNHNPRDRYNKKINNQTSRGNNRSDRSTRNSVITGISNSSTLTAATPRHTQKKDGLFISRLSRNTRSSDVVNYIRNEANLNLRCDPVPTKYDSYRSYYIHAHPRHHGLLLKPGMWPKDVIVRPYTSD